MTTTPQKDSNQSKFLTLNDLTSFTDEVLLPSVERIVEAHLSDVASDIGGLKSDMVGVKSDIGGLKSDMVGVKSDIGGLKSDITTLRKEMNSQFETVNEKLDDLKASANTLDDILEQHPIPQIERLEKHAHLSPYVRAFTEE